MSLASSAFLNQLKSLYPTRQTSASGVSANPWFIVAAVAYSACNRPEAVPRVFEHALQDIRSSSSLPSSETNASAESLTLARKMREAIFKSGLTGGYSKAINSLVALHEVMPDELKDTRMLRNPQTSMQEHERAGEATFRSIYGETADNVQGLLNRIYPDMGWFSNTIGYGLVYSQSGSLSQVETSYMLVATLIAVDTPRQIGWHIDGAKRGGATVEEVKAVRKMAMDVVEDVGMGWREGVPEVE